MRLPLLVFAAALTCCAQSNIRISQVYGGGGNQNATYTNDFIELYNPNSTAVSLTGWSVQYGSSTGTTWQRTDLAGTIPANGYFLIQESAGTGGTQSLPAPDSSGSLLMSATAGKVALVNSTTTLTGACPASTSYVDLIGYGSANCFEGAAAAPTLSNTNAALRLGNGATDTNNNATDFTSGAPNPRNSGISAPPPATCSPTHLISAVQGSGAVSPYAGAAVAVEGIVTARRSNGFHLQMAVGDNDPATSDAIFVFTSSAPPVSAAIGNLVCASGTVSEFRPSTDPNSPSVTELVGPLVITTIATGSVLPAPVPLTYGACGTTGTSIFECLESMRVTAPQLNVVAPTSGSENEPNATGISNGVFYAVLPGTPRPFREPGIPVSDPLPAGSPCCVPRFDENPERIRVDSDGQPGAPAIDVSTGATLTGVTGVLDYAFRTYTLVPDPSPAPQVTPGMSIIPAPDPLASEVTVASANFERFFDTVDDPAVSDVALTAAAFSNRLAKAALTIRDVLRLPDILGVVEVENLSTLQAVADRVNTSAQAAGLPDPGYQAFLFEGNDIGGIDVGFLVKPSKVTVVSVTQLGKLATYVNPATGQPELLFDRPPLVLQAIAKRAGSDSGLPLTVIVNHLRSLNSVEDPVDGPRVRAKREAEAEFVAAELQSRQAAGENVITIGDFNAFEVNDGYGDLIGAIRGAPAPPDQVVLASPDLVNPDYIDLAFRLPQAQRYSYVFDGNAQILDHAIVNQQLDARVSRFAYTHSNADFPLILRGDATRPERLSDHDDAITFIALPLEITSKAQFFRSGYVVNTAARTFSGNVRITNKTSATLNGPLYYVLKDLKAGVTLDNANGKTPEGVPYILIDANLNPGETVTIPVRFSSQPGLIAPAYTPTIYSEAY